MKSLEQFKQFYRALVKALPIVANSRSPEGLAHKIIQQLKKGVPHSYWDDFAAGVPIGTSTQHEWEIEPGVPYPMFLEYLTEKIKAGNNSKSDEQTRNEVFGLLDKPRQATAFWGQFKRSVVNVSEQVERDRALGVSSPNTPTWTRERIEPSIEEAREAGLKITAVNEESQTALESTRTPQLKSTAFPSTSRLHMAGFPRRASTSISPCFPATPDPWSDDERPQPTMREMLAERGVKGFCKPMPKVSRAEIEAEERKQTKPKTNIAQMSVAEINDYLADPVLRKQITPQLWHSNYESITDELGEIIAIKPPSSS